MVSFTRQARGSLLLTCGVMVGACGQGSHSALQHNTSQPVRAKDDWNWQRVNKEDFVETVLNPSGKITNLPVEDKYQALQDRTQFWVNRLDGKLRELHPEEMAQVPKPQVQVITDASPNAFVAASLACYDVPVHFSDSGEEVDKVFWNPSEGAGAFEEWPKSYHCLPATPETLYAAIEAFNQGSGTCKFQVKNGIIYPKASCTEANPIGAISEARGIVLPRTANWITIHAGLFPFLETERAFVGVITHELGHYYRSHLTHLPKEYDFFYTRQPKNPPRRPVAQAEVEKIGPHILRASRIIGEALLTVKNQAVAPELYFVAGSLAKEECRKNTDCAKSCQEISETGTSVEFLSKMQLYPFSVADEDFYHQFESTLQTCLQTLPFQGAKKEGYEAVRALMAHPTWIPFLKILSPAGKGMIMGVMEELAHRIPTTLSAPILSNMNELMLHLTDLLVKQKTAALSLLTYAHENHVGFYTAEQEADEESIEWLPLVGIDPSAGVETYLALAGDSDEATFGGLVWGGKTCKELYRNHWKDQSGKLVVVPLGNYAEPHHSTCFRAYNADLEIQAHKYPRIQKETQAIGLSWKELQKVAQKAMKQPAAEESSFTPEERTAQAAFHPYWHNCPWAPKG